MIVLRKLTGTAKAEDYVEPVEHHHHVGIDLGKGAFRVLRLGPKGLTVGDGQARVAIPIEELVALSERHLKKG